MRVIVLRRKRRPTVLLPLGAGGRPQPDCVGPGHDPDRERRVVARARRRQHVEKVQRRLLHDLHAAVLVPRREVAPREAALHGAAHVDGEHQLGGLDARLHPRALRDALGSGVVEEPFREEGAAEVGAHGNFHHPSGAFRDLDAERFARPGPLGGGDVAQDVEERPALCHGRNLLPGFLAQRAGVLLHLQGCGDRRRIGGVLHHVALADEPDVVDDEGGPGEEHDAEERGGDPRRPARIGEETAHGHAVVPSSSPSSSSSSSSSGSGRVGLDDARSGSRAGSAWRR